MAVREPLCSRRNRKPESEAWEAVWVGGLCLCSEESLGSDASPLLWGLGPALGLARAADPLRDQSSQQLGTSDQERCPPGAVPPVHKWALEGQGGECVPGRRECIWGHRLTAAPRVGVQEARPRPPPPSCHDLKAQLHTASPHGSGEEEEEGVCVSPT